jgi:thiosulfate dehydrogenase (quinone) large subunit
VSGLLTRLAAAAGLGLNLILFLTNSWHTSPYFLGSDIVFVFAWLPLVLTGATGQPALDHVIDRWGAEPTRTRAPAGRRAGPVPDRAGSEQGLTRRRILAQALGLTGLGALAIGGLSALVKGTYSGHAASALVGGRTTGGRTTRPAQHQRRQPSVPSDAVVLGPSNGLPAGQAATYRDPATGQPDILIRDSSGRLTAFSAVCTHAGCTVGYESGQIVCPCHGGVFNARTGAVESGPPPQGLQPRKVIEHRDRIYAVPG